MVKNEINCLDLSGLVGFPTETIQKPVKIEKGCFNLRGLAGILTTTIPKRVKIEKVASIYVV